MAQRPVFIPASAESKYAIRRDIDFRWYAGFSIQQKQRSIASLHQAAGVEKLSPLLEVSTKSPSQLGVALSAFNLPLNDSCVESLYQGSKVFEHGGPYPELFQLNARESRRDSRLSSSGELTGFFYSEQEWPLKPMTIFYDWLYLHGLQSNPDLAAHLLDFSGFTDIEFNPSRQISCQARSAALYVGLAQSGDLARALASPDSFLQTVFQVDGSKKQHHQQATQTKIDFDR